MEQPREQDTGIGNGDGNRPILASERQSMVDQSKPSLQSTNTAASNTKPVSLKEALSLLQTLCYDLQSMGCQVSILARKNRFYVVGAVPSDTGTLEIEQGHIVIDGKPVSEG